MDRSPAARPVIEASGIRKSFGDVEILKGVDLTVQTKELVFLIGPSGSGKSTLLRCCNLLERPTEGKLSVEGVDMLSPSVDINRMRQRIGMVFQSFNLYPHLSVLGNVTLALRKVLHLSHEEARQRAVDNLKLVGMDHKIDAYPSELSGGQQQRVGIARSMALEPSVILMDEPTSALDPELVGSVLAVVKELRDRGMTMVIASHEMGFAREAADKIVFLDGGVVIEQGSGEEMFGGAKEERTRRFLKQVRH